MKQNTLHNTSLSKIIRYTPFVVGKTKIVQVHDADQNSLRLYLLFKLVISFKHSDNEMLL